MNSQRATAQHGSQLSILVAGHRENRLPTSGTEARQRISDRLAEVLDILGAAVRDMDSGESCALRVLTGQADGVDTETTELCAGRGLPLHLLVPDAISSRLTPQHQAAERVVALGATAADRPAGEFAADTGVLPRAAYGTRDAIALSLSDLLVAVWDGRESGGIAGGTVRLIHRALLQRKPVIRIDRDGRIQLSRIQRLTDAYLHKLRAYDAHPALMEDDFADVTEDPTGPIGELITRILTPWAVSDSKDEEAKRLRNEAPEAESSVPAPLKRNWCGWLEALFAAVRRLNRKGLNRSPSYDIGRPDLGEAAPDQSYPVDQPGDLMRVFKASDMTANLASGKHRRAVWLLYLAAAFALFAAVLGAIHAWPCKLADHFWGYLESICLVLIALLVGLAICIPKHKHWLQKRYLAELLRYAIMGYPLLALPTRLETPLWRWATRRSRTLLGPDQRRAVAVAARLSAAGPALEARA